MTEMYAPVVVFVYNRSEHAKMTLASLNALKEAPQTDLFVFSDGAKNESSLEKVNQVREMLDRFSTEESRFHRFTVYRAEKNKGLANSIIDGVTQIIRQYGRVIVLEDDLEVSCDFLQYMNGALDYYEKDSRIWSISGYNYSLECMKHYPGDVYFAGRGCSWGWASWKDRWETVDWKIPEYRSMRFHPVLRSQFGQWGADMPGILDEYMCGKNSSWAIRWCYAACKQKRYTVYPKVSRVCNHGTDGSGTHFTKATTSYDTVLNTEKKPCVFSDLCIDEKIRKEFKWKCINRIGLMRCFCRLFWNKLDLRRKNERF